MRGDGETDSDATLSDGSIGITEGSAAGGGGGGGGGGNSLRGLLDVLRRTLVGAKRPSDRATDVPPPTRARTNVCAPLGLGGPAYTVPPCLHDGRSRSRARVIVCVCCVRPPVCALCSPFTAVHPFGAVLLRLSFAAAAGLRRTQRGACARRGTHPLSSRQGICTLARSVANIDVYRFGPTSCVCASALRL